MKPMRTWRWLPAALVLALAGAKGLADDLAITSYEKDSNLVFRTAGTSSTAHFYRLEQCTSLVSQAWSTVATVGGVGASWLVTNDIANACASTSAFYRVVATFNSAAFVDGAYMSIDISGGTNAASYPVTYYRTLADLPGGANSDAYKTTYMLVVTT